MEGKRQVISKHKKKPIAMVVYHTPAGKNAKGKQILHSKTVHEKI
jgi:hypothetical protein